MNLKTFLPADNLLPYVKYFYVMESNATGHQQQNLRAMADGCPGILFQKSAAGSFLLDQKALPDLFLFGQSTKHLDMALNGNFDAIGVALQPNALQGLFGMNAEILTDSCLDLNLLSTAQGHSLSDKLEHAATTSEKINILNNYLIRELNRNKYAPNPKMDYALQKILVSNGAVSLKELQLQLNLSERSFERKFNQHVGISPKLYSRICSFQAALKQLNTHNFEKLSDIAYTHNYADQSHFIRSFKQFSGLSPNQYQKRSNELVENLTQLKD